MADPTARKTKVPMCFSATASFGAATVLAGVGTISIHQNTSRRHRMMALIPLLFALQQSAEGIVWLTIDRPAEALLLSLSVNVFLGFALVVWPTWLPVSLLLLEGDARRQRFMRVSVWIGAAVSAAGVLVLVLRPPVVRIAGHSIAYGYPNLGNRAIEIGYFLLYLVPAVVPAFLSRMRLAHWIGGVLLVSLIMTIVIKVQALTSVWCFFATAISCLIVLGTHKRQRLPKAMLALT